jgi:predicted dehydrogenase
MLNFALVGAGRIAKRHSELLGHKQIKNACLRAVCDIVEDKARAIGERFNVPYYTDMHRMLEKEKDIDVVSVLTPSGMHAEHVIGLAKYRKHIIVEKPLALSLSQADDMVKICGEQGIKLFVVKQNRFNLPVQKLREAVAQKKFGKLVMGTVRLRWCRRQEYYDTDSWRGTHDLDGGVFVNQASHHIDLLEWMMGDVVSVFAKARTALVDIEAADTGVAVLKFKNGALGVIEATTATRPTDLEGSISILGERGTVEISGFAVNELKTWSFINQDIDEKEIIKNYSVNPPNVYGFGHQSYYEHVVDCILNNKEILVDGIEAKKSIKLILAMKESIKTGEEVFLANLFQCV